MTKGDTAAKAATETGTGTGVGTGETTATGAGTGGATGGGTGVAAVPTGAADRVPSRGTGAMADNAASQKVPSGECCQRTTIFKHVIINNVIMLYYIALTVGLAY